MTEFSFFLADEAATLAAGTALASALKQQTSDCHWVVNLQGNLGAGKTTLSRGVLQGLGHQSSVKSPTYTLVEPYDLPCGHVYHFDLYRLRDPEELEYLGAQEYFDHGFLCLVEWPEKGAGRMPPPDISIALAMDPAMKNTGRSMVVTALSPSGESALKSFSLLVK